MTDGSDVTTTPGTAVTMTFSGFGANEPTTASAPDAVTLGVVKVVSTFSRAANASGVVSYSVTASTPGTYTVTVTGVSGKVAVGTLTVVPADSGAGSGSGADSNGALPNTGLETPMLIIWGAAGALALGIALTVVLTIVRRQKASV
ncbi:hypothetical protein [Agreia sp.]|uniref:hypothetical protein n=1 Tax=Agreia sp. TaxID=1872416 RepID=UPI0035BC670E